MQPLDRSHRTVEDEALGTLPKSLAGRSLALYAALMVYLVLAKVVLDLASIEEIAPGQAATFRWPSLSRSIRGAPSCWRRSTG